MEKSRTGQRLRRALTERDMIGVDEMSNVGQSTDTLSQQIKLQKPMAHASQLMAHSNTYGWMMSDYEDLLGQILCFGGVAPLAGRGANDTQCVQQDTRGNVAAAQLSQLSRL